MNKFKDTVKEWMKKEDALEVVIEGKMVSVLQRRNKMDYQAHLFMWLEGELSTEKFLKEYRACRKYWWVGYPLDVFEDMIYSG
jgi:hypothetical protein